MTSRVIWTETLRTRLAALKKAGMTHVEAAQRMGLTVRQVEHGWRMHKDGAPFQTPPVAIDEALIRKVQSMRRRGLYRSEIARKLGLNTTRIDAIISTGRDEGYDMDMNIDIYSDRQSRHGLRSREGV